MKIQNIKAFKTVYYPRVNREEEDKEINKMLSNGWRLLSIDENPNKSAYMYFVHKKNDRGVRKMRTLIAVKDNEGNVYTMPSNTDKCIIEIHYSTSYYTFIVQDVITGEDGEKTYPKSTIIVPINKENWIDFLAVKESEIGELVEEVTE